MYYEHVFDGCIIGLFDFKEFKMHMIDYAFQHQFQFEKFSSLTQKINIELL